MKLTLYTTPADPDEPFSGPYIGVKVLVEEGDEVGKQYGEVWHAETLGLTVTKQANTNGMTGVIRT